MIEPRMFQVGDAVIDRYGFAGRVSSVSPESSPQLTVQSLYGNFALECGKLVEFRAAPERGGWVQCRDRGVLAGEWVCAKNHLGRLEGAHQMTSDNPSDCWAYYHYVWTGCCYFVGCEESRPHDHTGLSGGPRLHCGVESEDQDQTQKPNVDQLARAIFNLRMNKEALELAEGHGGAHKARILQIMWDKTKPYDREVCEAEAVHLSTVWPT